MDEQETSADAHLIQRLNRIRALLDSVGPEVLGHRIRRLRDRQGLSIREVADRAQVSKNSIVRLEQGGGTQPITLLRVCSVLGLHVERLAEPTGEDMRLAATHRAADDRWFDAGDMGSAPLLEADRPLTAAERKGAVRGGVKTPVNMLQCRLPGGCFLPSVLEVFEETAPRSHVGEELAYVLEGQAVITVGGEAHVLSQGEAITFWSAEPHTYAPADSDEVPVRILSVRIDG